MKQQKQLTELDVPQRISLESQSAMTAQLMKAINRADRRPEDNENSQPQNLAASNLETTITIEPAATKAFEMCCKVMEELIENFSLEELDAGSIIHIVPPGEGAVGSNESREIRLQDFFDFIESRLVYHFCKSAKLGVPRHKVISE